ncbi:hypothetical protein [Actinoplanes sp. NPDC051494]|uniref:hypothetical protein n=1 Tax=Actinoplanes sp. NPDC051494 TaxID=3363907 RepID=UPI0037A05039
MTIPGNSYATAVDLLTDGGIEWLTATVGQQVTCDSLRALAALADTDRTAVQVVQHLASLDAQGLAEVLRMDDRRHALIVRDSLAFRPTGGAR